MAGKSGGWRGGSLGWGSQTPPASYQPGTSYPPGSYAPTSTYIPPSYVTVAPVSYGAPSSGGPGRGPSRGWLVASVVLAILLIGAIVGAVLVLGKYNSEKQSLATSQGSLATSQAALASSEAGLAKSTVSLSNDKAIGTILGSYGSGLGEYEQGALEFLQANTQADATSALQLEVDGVTSAKKALGSAAPPAAIQPQTSALENDLSNLLTAAQAAQAATVSGDVNGLATAFTQESDAEQKLVPDIAALYGKIGTT
jgi:hypothetical protein